MVTPYITFAGNCNEALAFYQKAFGSTIQMLQTYGDYVPDGVAAPPADLGNWVLHAEMQICGTKFWFADEAAAPVTKGSMIKLTASVPNAAQAQRIYDCLSAGAHITLPPTDTFYSTFHAGLVDRYGIGWNIVAEEAPNQK